MVIHILPDDKYVDTFVKDVLAAAEPGSQQFLVRDPFPFKYLDPVLGYVPVDLHSDSFKEKLRTLTEKDLVVIHFLSQPIIDWLAEVETNARLGWAYWGSDFYENCYPDVKIYDKLTKRYWMKQEPLSRFKVLHYYRLWLKKRKDQKVIDWRREVTGKALSKLHYIYHFMKKDYDKIAESYQIKANFIYFHYRQPFVFGEIEEIAARSEVPQLLKGFKKRIWVGNCGYPAVNHLDAFELLKGSDNDTAIVVPLSYGNEKYVKHIMDTGKAMFGERFVPLTEYLPFNEFVAYLKHVDVAIMPHNTPWALGNIVMLLGFGKRVYVKNHIATYSGYKGQGVTIEDYADFDLIKCFVPVPTPETELFLKIIRKDLSNATAKEMVHNLINSNSH